MVVLEPASVASIFPVTVHAFNLAETLRTPVILLTSKHMALSKQTVDTDHVKLPSLQQREYFDGSGDYIPYQWDRPFNIPKFLPMGSPRPVRVTGSMHDERGYLTKDPGKAKEKLLHLQKKITENGDRIETVALDLEQGADTLLIAYGVNASLCGEVVGSVRRRGKGCSMITIESLFPIPEKPLKSALKGVRKVIVPELNVGLYSDAIKPFLTQRQKLIPVLRFDGEPLSPDDVMNAGGLR